MINIFIGKDYLKNYNKVIKIINCTIVGNMVSYFIKVHISYNATQLYHCHYRMSYIPLAKQSTVFKSIPLSTVVSTLHAE